MKDEDENDMAFSDTADYSDDSNSMLAYSEQVMEVDEKKPQATVQPITKIKAK